MQSLTDFLTDAKTKAVDKCLELLRYFYAGFLTVSEYHKLIELYDLGGMDTMATVEKFLEENKNFLPATENEEESVLSGVDMRRFVFDIDEAKSLVRGKNYFDVWKMRLESPEGFAVSVGTDSDVYEVNGYEEYGLNRINRYLVTRTCKKYVLSDRPLNEEGKDTAIQEDVVVIFPDISERQIVERYQGMTSIDGGFGFVAKCRLVSLMDNMRTKYHCPARYAFIALDACAEDTLETKDK